MHLTVRSLKSLKALLITISENEPITCERLQRLGYEDGMYRLDVDGIDGPLKPFPAMCRMEDSTTTIAAPQLGDVFGKKTVTCTSGCSNKVEPFTYFLNNSNFGSNIWKEVIRHSKFCSQKLEMECTMLGIWSAASPSISYWSTKDNLRMMHWPGGKASGGCSCGQDGTCATSGKIINIITKYYSHA